MPRSYLLAGTVLAAACLGACSKHTVEEGVVASPVVADAQKGRDIVVTGSRISNPNLNSLPRAELDSMAMAPPPPPPPPAPGMYQQWAPPYHDVGRDKFTMVVENAFKVVREEPVSTFSIDVDTASYSWVRAS